LALPLPLPSLFCVLLHAVVLLFMLQHYSLFCGIVLCTKVGQQCFSLPIFVLLCCALPCHRVFLQEVMSFISMLQCWHVLCRGIGDCIVHHAMALATAFHGLVAVFCIMPWCFSLSCGIFL